MTEIPSRLNAALEGRYVVERGLGEGGMATVYLARDLRHDRNVALKVLKPELAAVVGAERFLAEIQTTAKLQHPHILPLHDSGEADSFLYYVMPYVEGESLGERMDRERQLPVDEAVRIATDLAEALDYAHRQGVIHRDIKPANVMMHEGRPLIADFGIALAVGAGGASRLTETGLSVGTPYYMSPEQATGDTAVGPQSDTYSLGCVLYEMLTGDPPYMGSTAQAVLGKIIQGEPVSATRVRRSVPLNVDSAVRKALERLPADRFRDARGFAAALADPAFRHGEAVGDGVGAAAGPWNRLSMALAATTVLFAAAFAWTVFSAPTEVPQPVERFASPFLEGQAPLFIANSFRPQQTLARDGSMLVYRGPGDEPGERQLWARRWAELEAHPIQGTESATLPAVSPDGLELAFLQEGELRVLAFQGGPTQTLLEDLVLSAVWGEDGYIYATTGRELVRVPRNGGEAEVLYRHEEGQALILITDLLPGGMIALATFATGPGDMEVRAVDLRSGEAKTLAPGMSPRYAASGHLIYLSPPVDASLAATLMAARFDVDEVELLGQPVALMDGLQEFSLSRTGKLFYLAARGTAPAVREAVWVTRDGTATPVQSGWTFERGGGDSGLSLSPDGTKLAVRAVVDGNPDVWIKDLEDGSYTRLTRSGGEESMPRWTPDGERVTYVFAGEGHQFDVLSRAANGIGDAEVVLDHSEGLAQGFYSPDGEWLILRTITSAGASRGRDILGLRVGVDSVATPLLTAEYGEGAPALSPDSRWMAYNSDESGRYEVFVRPFPDVESDKIPVSTDGGIAPLWAHSGRELFYVDGDRNVIAARVETEPTFRVVGRDTLFTVPAGIRPSGNSYVTGLWDIAPDDERFLMLRPYQPPEGQQAEEDAASPAPRYVLVLSFFEELKQRLGG